MDRSLIEAHRRRADQHKISASLFGSVEEPLKEWQIVIRFYAALHIVDSYLLCKNESIKPSNHHERWRIINQYPELSSHRGSKFKTAYKRLQEVSEQVRYDPSFLVKSDHISSSDNDMAHVFSYLNNKIDNNLKCSC